MSQFVRAALRNHAALGIGLLCGGLLSFAAPARGNLTIVPDYSSFATPGPNQDPNYLAIEATINIDIANLESYIANPITVPVTFSEINSGLADSFSNNYYDVTYSTYLSHLAHNQTLSAADKSALTSLGLTAPFNGPYPSSNPVNGNSQLIAPGTILNALGFSTITGGTVQFNPSIVYDSRSNPVVGKYDLQSAVAHELDEILGIGGAGSNLDNVVEDPSDFTLSGPPGLLDLYRYSSSGVRSYTTSNTAVSYFSIDGGNTDLVHFNQRGAIDDSDFADWGDGVTPADGQNNTPPQVQDAYAGPYEGPGTLSNLGANELTALDVIGWNLTSTGQSLEVAPVPEPASFGLFALGAIGLFGLFGHRRLAAI